ncbi:TetR/AcrR family transcriptional regulator [Deinococcus humi]|uniref:AcrR family transcriptional regulator n=1 Tax=Deinococcus humi TaxID=662880 RepID=A0A7W8NIN8_9DEIO|nr:TetR/AcrR family transcriptional regulator [Deinococcus humi]MBB5365252.1 AcrR family transcriptional regulator [Deinococcus humi]GGO35762.1 TetR family transcriptional regulator [Deinococcus humi]
MTQTRTPRPKRQDAQRNRETILAVAVDTFSQAGLDASLEAIARQAGVGIGTLYRHFPTREALAVAAYRHEVEQLCEKAAELASALPPDQALREWMGRFVGYVAAKRGMAPILRTVLSSDDEYFTDLRAQIHGALDSLLRHAIQAGVIRPDAKVSDVMQAMSGVWLVSAEREWRDQAERLLDLLMDGLRYGANGETSTSGARPV